MAERGPFHCKICDLEISNESLVNHRKRVHQKLAKADIQGIKHSAERTHVDGHEVGFFLCPRVGCDYRSIWPNKWTTHFNSCKKDLPPPQVPQAAIANGDENSIPPGDGNGDLPGEMAV